MERNVCKTCRHFDRIGKTECGICRASLPVVVVVKTKSYSMGIAEYDDEVQTRWPEPHETDSCGMHWEVDP